MNRLHTNKFSVALTILLLALFGFYAIPTSGQGTELKDPPAQEQDQADEKDDSSEEKDESKDETESADEENEDQDEDEEEADKEEKKPSRVVSASIRNSKRSPEFAKLFESVVGSASASTVVINGGRRQIAMGTIVGTDGFILTKASELRGELKCKLNDGKFYEATVFGVDPSTDLALLKISAENLPVIKWSDKPTPQTGRWLATPTLDSEPLAIGVVSVNEREIPPSRPFIGIQMQGVPNNGGVRITRVIPGTPADRAGIFVNDVIVKIDDTDITDNPSLFKAIGQYSIGDTATLSAKRGSKDIKFQLVLGDEKALSPQGTRARQQNSMGSTPSKRRKDFPLAFQHDSQLDAKYCGGPIVDLDGNVVGVNIARDGRVSSFSLPRSIVEPVVKRLKSGEFKPAVVNAEKIKRVDAQLKEIIAVLDELPDRKVALERKVGVSNARKEELERMLKDIEARLKTIEEKSQLEEVELKSIDREIKSAYSSKRRLESRKKNLSTGAR